RRNDLIDIFSEFINILKDNPIKPIISGLKIESNNGLVTFTGTNLDINYIKTLSAETAENGIVIFKPNLALEYIKLLEDENITLSSKNDILSIHLAEFTLLYNDGFPENLKLTVIDEIAKISPQELYKGFEKTKFSVAPSTENLAINCIRTLFRKDRISFVSTDSYRLTYLKTDNNAFLEKDFSIPLETINILCKLIKDLNSEITIGSSGENLIFLWENSYFLTKIINLPFPNFDAILCGNNFSKEMEFNHIDFKSSLKKVLTVARTSSESKNGAILDFKSKKLSISASSGKAKINQKVDMIKIGDDFKCSLNIKFLFEFIENINKNVFIKGNSSSALFEITEKDNSSYKYILMPLALRD
ncbi:MAG: DNA polymerase III subunit beta, partial [Cetobacterium sp.]